MAAAGSANGRGRGGMLTKVEAARMVMEAGKIAVIASGRTPGMVERVCAGEDAGTVFARAGMSAAMVETAVAISVSGTCAGCEARWAEAGLAFDGR